MVDEYLTDEQQAERAREWLRENGLYIAAGVLLGLGGLFGWQQWNDYQTGQAGDASVIWEQMRDAIEGGRYNEVDETLVLLEQDYAATAYLDQARLALARMYVERNDVESAVAELRELTNQGNDPQLRKIGALRLAQLLIAEEQYAEALQLLDADDGSALEPLRSELRGDALYSQGDFAAASEAYEAALQNDTGNVIDRSFVQMKFDDATAEAARLVGPQESAPDVTGAGDE